MLETWQAGNRMVWRRNPEYFKSGIPYLDELVFLTIPSDASASSAFLTGEVDVLGLTCDEGDRVKRAMPAIQKEDNLTGGPQGYISMNASRPPFDDLRVRRAVSLAFNWKGESQALACGLAERDQILPRGQWKRAVDPKDLGEAAQFWEYDPARARRLLGEAGYSNGFKTSALFTPAYGQTYAASCERAVGDFKQVGIEVEPKSIEYGAWSKDIFRPPFNFEGMLWVPGRVYPDPEPYLWYSLHPSGIANHTRVNDADIIALLEQQRKEFDEDRRWQLLSNIQRLSMERMHYVGRSTGASSTVWASWLKGFRSHGGYDSNEFNVAWDERRP
jgi:peptide/nickel transport system substrate-binding protein